MILITYSDSSLKIESDEYIFIDMRRDSILAVSIFRHTIFGSGLLVVPDIFGVFLFFRLTIFTIFSKAIFSRVWSPCRVTSGRFNFDIW
jgi:hypothetical protein